jgi:hypothetical protein
MRATSNGLEQTSEQFTQHPVCDSCHLLRVQAKHGMLPVIFDPTHHTSSYLDQPLTDLSHSFRTPSVTQVSSAWSTV